MHAVCLYRVRYDDKSIFISLFTSKNCDNKVDNNYFNQKLNLLWAYGPMGSLSHLCFLEYLVEAGKGQTSRGKHECIMHGIQGCGLLLEFQLKMKITWKMT